MLIKQNIWKCCRQWQHTQHWDRNHKHRPRPKTNSTGFTQVSIADRHLYFGVKQIRYCPVLTWCSHFAACHNQPASVHPVPPHTPWTTYSKYPFWAMASGSSNRLTTGIMDHGVITDSKRGIWGIHQSVMAAGRFQSMAFLACWQQRPRSPFSSQGHLPATSERNSCSGSSLSSDKIQILKMYRNRMRILMLTVPQLISPWNLPSRLSLVFAHDMSQNTVPGEPHQPVFPLLFFQSTKHSTHFVHLPAI